MDREIIDYTERQNNSVAMGGTRVWRWSLVALKPLTVVELIATHLPFDDSLCGSC